MLPSAIRVLVATVSDSRKKADDESGAVLQKRLSDAGFGVRRHAPIRDDMAVIRELARSAATSNEADVIVLTGGTGIAPRDVTPEAIEPLFEKRIDGFGEEFRRRSLVASPDLGARAMLARVTAGVISQAIVVALPGSPDAAELGAMLLVDMLPHAVEVATGRAHRKPK
jgi:molybdenum cofactor biosynthesis protein B